MGGRGGEGGTGGMTVIHILMALYARSNSILGNFITVPLM